MNDTTSFTCTFQTFSSFFSITITTNLQTYRRARQ